MAIRITEDGTVIYENEPEVDRELFPNIKDNCGCQEQIDEIKENLSELQELVGTKAGVIYETTSGSVASFTDGADDMPLKSCVVNIEPIQEGEGDPSPENVRPISGRTGLSVVRKGKNLLNLPVRSSTVVNGITSSVAENNLVTASGESTGNGDINFDLTDNIVLKANQAYTLGLNGTDTRSGNFTVFFRNADSGSLITVGPIATADHSITYTPSEDTVVNYVKLRLPVGRTIELNANLQLELGSTATDYETYKGNTYSVKWQTEAGTVYGGTIDVVSGKLVVDRAMVTLDGTHYTLGGRNAFTSVARYYVNQSIQLRARGRDSLVMADRATPSYNATIGISNNTPTGYYIWVYGSNTVFITLPVDVASSNAEATAWLAENSIQFVYELAVPTEIQLTPQEARTLLGENSIWSDSGDMAVEYPADTKMYIEKLTEPTENDMIADHAISANSFFVVGNTLYRATTAIANGATITDGTNAVKMSLSDALNALA